MVDRVSLSQGPHWFWNLAKRNQCPGVWYSLLVLVFVLTQKSNLDWQTTCYKFFRQERRRLWSLPGTDDFVTKKYVFEMLKVQESLFRNLFDSLLANVNSRIDDLIKDLTGLKSSYSFHRKTLKTSSRWPIKMTKTEKKIGEVQVDHYCDKRDCFENQSSRNIIRIDGMPDEPVETCKGKNWT